jgi:hypothetical protein
MKSAIGHLAGPATAIPSVLGSLPLGWTQYDKQQILTPGPRSTRANDWARTAMTPTEALLIIIMFGGVCVVVGVVICIGLFIVDALARHWSTQPRSGHAAGDVGAARPKEDRKAARQSQGSASVGNSERIRKL